MRTSLMVLLLALLGANFVSAQTLKVGFFQNNSRNANMIVEADGTVRGITADYLTDLMKEAGYRVEWVGPATFLRLVQMLKEGQIDALIGFSYLKEREEFVWYPEKTYDTNRFWLMVNKAVALEAVKTWEDLRDLSILVPSGAKLPPILADHGDRLKLERLPNSSDWGQVAQKMLQSLRVDALLSSVSVNRDLAPYEFARYLALPGEPDDIFLGFSKKSPLGNAAVAKYNEIVKQTKLRYRDYIQRYE